VSMYKKIIECAIYCSRK